MANLSDRENAIIGAVRNFALTTHFPHDQTTRDGLLEMLDAMCETPESIAWLGQHIRDKYVEWPGSAIVRGVYCSRYKPLDGTPGYLPTDDITAREMEQRAIVRRVEHERMPNKGLMLLGELMSPQAVAEEHERKRQDLRWFELWASRKHLQRSFRTLSNEFATTDSVARRKAIIDEITELEKPGASETSNGAT